MTWLLAVLDEVPADETVVSASGLHAVVDIGADEQSPDRDLLLAHAARVTALLGSTDAVLPVRGGTRLPDASAVRDLLLDHHDALVRGLDAVRGCVELAVTAMLPEPPQSSTEPSARGARTGAEFLQSRARQWEWAARLVSEDAHRSLPGVRDVQALAAKPGLVKLSLLVEAPLLEVAAAASRRVVERSGARARCTGPHPPYSFSPSFTEGVPA
jgi:hypothetical protein